MYTTVYVCNYVYYCMYVTMCIMYVCNYVYYQELMSSAHKLLVLCMYVTMYMCILCMYLTMYIRCI